MSAGRTLSHVLALAELRVRQGIAARLGWIVALGFLVGLGAALWAPGADLATRAATADRAALGAVAGLAVLAALVSAATTIPGEIVDGAADRLLGSPVPRGTLLVAGMLGHGALASVVLVGGVAAALLGLEAGGLGSSARSPTRAYLPVNPDVTAEIRRDAPTAEIALALPPEHLPADELVLHLTPRAVNEGGDLERIVQVPMVLGQPGGADLPAEAGWAPGRDILVRFPVGRLDPRLPLRLTIHRPEGTWGMDLAPGSIEAGGPPRLFLATALKSALCVLPLLFLVAAAGQLGAARFGAPTALGVALFLLTLFAGQDVLREGAEFVVREADIARRFAAEGHHADDGHGHEHAPGEISPLQERLASAALVGLDLLPPLDAYDRTGEVLAGRDVPAGDGGRAAWLALPGIAVLLGASWLLIARRDVLPT